MARTRKPITEIVVAGLDEYLSAHDIQFRLDAGNFYYKQGTGKERYLATANRNALQLLKLMASKLGIPFLFQAMTGKFKGTVGSPRVSGYSSNQVKFWHGKDFLQGFSMAEFLRTHQLSTASAENLVYDTANIPKDAFGSSFVIDDLVLIGHRAGIFTEWDPLKERARINFGSSVQWIHLGNDCVDLSRIDQGKIRNQLMIKRLMKK